MNQDEIHTQVAGALIAIGDPFVLPTLRRWLRDAVKADGEFNLHSMKTVGCAVEGVKQFRDGESHELLELLLKPTDLDHWKREAVVSAIAELGLARANRSRKTP